MTFAGLAVPGATVTATQGERRVVTSTDQQGVFKLGELADGSWTLQVEMLGFSTIRRDITIAGEAQPTTWELPLLPFDEMGPAKAGHYDRHDTVGPGVCVCTDGF